MKEENKQSEKGNGKDEDWGGKRGHPPKGYIVLYQRGQVGGTRTLPMCSSSMPGAPSGRNSSLHWRKAREDALVHSKRMEQGPAKHAWSALAQTWASGSGT